MLWFHRRLIGRLAESQNWRCCYCGVKLVTDDHTSDDFLTTDHVKPTGQGGAKEWANKVAACLKCNNGRGDLDAMVFFRLVRQHGRERAVKIAREAMGRRDSRRGRGLVVHDTTVVSAIIVVKARDRRMEREKAFATLADVWPRR